MSAVLRIVADNCEFCGGRRKVFSSDLDIEIRCVECTRPAADPMPALPTISALVKDEKQEISLIDWTRSRLKRWGRMVRDRGIGYPSMSTTEKVRVGNGARSGELRLPPDIEEIDEAVATAPIAHKVILIEHYTKEGNWRDHAAHLGLQKDAYFRRKNEAESYMSGEV